MHDWLRAVTDYDERLALCKLRVILDSGVECGAAVGQILHIYEQMLFARVCAEESEWAPYAAKLSKEALLRGIEVFTDAQGRMKYVPKPEIILEAAVLRAMLPTSEKAQNEALWREEAGRLEAKLAALQNGTAIQAEIAANVGQERAEEQAKKQQRIDTVPQRIDRAEPCENAVPAPEEDLSENYWPWLKQSCAEDLGAQPMFRGLELVREDMNTIYLRATNPVVRMMIESGERKQELQEKMDAQFGRHKNIQVTQIEQSQQLPEEVLIDIID